MHYNLLAPFHPFLVPKDILFCEMNDRFKISAQKDTVVKFKACHSKGWFFPSPDFQFCTCFRLWSPLCLCKIVHSQKLKQIIYITVETDTCRIGNLTKMRIKKQLQPQL